MRSSRPAKRRATPAPAPERRHRAVRAAPAAPGAAPRARGRPRSAQAHQAILDATLALLAEKGYERLTVEDVATAAGVGKATIYRRWPAKVSLVIAAYAHLPELAQPDTGNLSDDLTALLRSFARILETTPLPRVLPILAGECMHEPAMARLLVPINRRRRKPLLGVLERAVSRGELPADLDLGTAADLIVGPIMTRIYFTGEAVRAKDIRRFVEAALSGIQRLRRGQGQRGRP
jgi:AcrR family transcriptional regulator